MELECQRLEKNLEEAKRKLSAFRDTGEYEAQKEKTLPATGKVRTQEPWPKGFTQLPKKEEEKKKPRKQTLHRSTGKSADQFGKPWAPHLLDWLLNMEGASMGSLIGDPDHFIVWTEASIKVETLTREVSALRHFHGAADKVKEVLGILKWGVWSALARHHHGICTWPSWLTDHSWQIPHYAPFPLRPIQAVDIRLKAKLFWEDKCSWLQYWHDATDAGQNIFFGRGQTIGQLVSGVNCPVHELCPQ